MTTVDVVIVAAGNGTRLGESTPKQFLPLAGIPMLSRTYEIFRTHLGIRNIQVVIGEGQNSFYDKIFPPHPNPLPQGEREQLISREQNHSPPLAGGVRGGGKLLSVVTGGARRQDSVLAGLDALTKSAPDYVLIVDAARPFTTHQIIDDVIAALAPNNAVLTALPVADTIRHAAGGETKTIWRDGHYLAQTPQAFPFAKILELHRKIKHIDFTDDVALFEAQGLPVKIVPGTRRNFKITTAEDFQMAEALLQTQIKIGHGFDVHRFKDGDHVWLGGVKIPHTRGVEAHSDGDVILHALTDAVLGACGAGDIGQHFPPSDAKWKNASSYQFVRHAVELLRVAGGAVVNADITLLCEAPRVGPHRDAVRARVAELLGVPVVQVNIKATTTEKLGALGRAEGLAAEAVVLVRV